MFGSALRRWKTGSLQASTRQPRSCRRRPVNPHATATTIVSLKPNPSTFGDVVQMTAQVTPTIGNVPPTGTVVFQDGNTVLGNATLSPDASGTATATFDTTATQLSGGTHT